MAMPRFSSTTTDRSGRFIPILDWKSPAPDLFKNYIDLGALLKKDLPGWEVQLNDMGRPVIMVDHEHNWDIGATLFRSAHWRCVWFDAIVAVFVHDSNASVVRAHAVDFAARHFRPDPGTDSRSLAELKASAKAFRSYAPAVAPPGGELGRPFYWLGIDDARSVLRLVPDSSEAWKLVGQIELFRAFPSIDARSPRFRAAFDPVLDLSMVRATYALRRASELAPRDFSTLLSLRMAYDFRLMNEAALPLVDRLASLYTTNLHQSGEQAKNEAARAEYLRKLGSPPATTWRNLSDLDQIVTDTLAAGRVESAAVLLERAYPPEKAPWEIDRQDGYPCGLHLGEPARARELWQKASDGTPAGHSRLAYRHDLPGRRRLRRGPPPLSSKRSMPTQSSSRPITAWPCSSKTPVKPGRPTITP